MYIDFEFAGKRLSDFGYIVCKFNSSSDATDVEIGCDITFNSVKNNHSSIRYKTSTSYENVYTTYIEIMKNPCRKNQDELYHQNEEISALTMWLNRHGYYKFKPLSSTDDFSSIHYYGSFNVKEKVINNMVVGLCLSFEGNAPYGFGNSIKNEFESDYILSKASGEVVTTTDSAKVKPKNIKLFGKGKQRQYEGKNSFDINANDNIISANQASGVREGNNITITTRIADSGAYCMLPQTISLKAGLPYICSFKTVNATGARTCGIAFFKDGELGAFLWGMATYTPKEDIDVNLGVYVYGEGSVGDTVIITDIQCEQNTVATEYEPYVGNEPSPSMNYPQIPEFLGESGSISGKVLTKNLWNKEYASDVNNWYINMNDGNKGYKEMPIFVGKGNTVTFSYSQITTGLDIYCGVVPQTTIGIPDEAWLYHGNSPSHTKNLVMLTAIEDYVYFRVYGELGIFMQYIGNDLQIEYGSTKTEYEPYTEQPFTIQTPNGLRGVPLGQTIPDAIKNSPIHMNGVYWDNAEGQYYIADTKNENGKDVQRIGEYVVTGDEDYADFISSEGYCVFQLCNMYVANNCMLSTHGGSFMANSLYAGFLVVEHFGVTSLAEFRTLARGLYNSDTPLSLYYILAEPVVTESDAQYDVVMNYPNTTIVNDAGAYMEVEYVQEFDTSFFIHGEGDEYTLIYPVVTVSPKIDCVDIPLEIENRTTGTKVILENLKANEIIRMHGEHKIIVSDNEEHSSSSTFYDDFNYEWLDIKIEDGFYENEYYVNVPCYILIEYEPIRKVGVC